TLYALTFAIPAAGLIMVLYEGSADLFFGLIDLRGKPLGSEDVAELFSEIHMWLGWALVLVLVGHISAALGHQFLLKDGLLYRMLPALSRTRRA
ncbi:MAG: cytochrome b, partial [bacterium]|nr:cytochrome b [bacterium]